MRVPVAIVGAGPYALSLATQLRAREIGFRIFGEPMGAWAQMLEGSCLKSPAFAVNVYSANGAPGFVEWSRQRGFSTAEPCPIDLFTRYGKEVQQAEVPELEQVLVTSIAEAGAGFAVRLSTGEELLADSVVIATGLSHYEVIPTPFSRLPSSRVRHTTGYRDHSDLRGARVAVVGAGASALEAAAHLRHLAASVVLLVRSATVSIGLPPPRRRSLRSRLLDPMSVMGPGRKNFALERLPWAFHHLPEERRVRFARGYLGPAGGWWLTERLGGRVPIWTGTRVTRAAVQGGGLRLELEGGAGPGRLEVDHVVCGTGYQPDLERLPFLDRELASRLVRVERAPALSRHFQTSRPGLYFIGPASVFSFGPLFRFVAGARYAAPTVARHIGRTRAGRAYAVPVGLTTDPASA